ncbi:hypothetical protein HELRODRAFT_181423 [Helobdella robusta]|uniref:Uncharacterized protein n=1 Tax=Helobdella robusta TaxID=6412 RepID=T1FGZ9_HELRO|nr:hypothetical protein HELRODRAFT_181423 [Helobdella robusta]ESN92378.1 hypothetical protein HELRODRAFT_181423 [Helobdella robusta]
MSVIQCTNSTVSFGSNCERFTPKGLHPNLLKTSTSFLFQHNLNNLKILKSSQGNPGPGHYDCDGGGDFSEKSIRERLKIGKDSWKKQLQLETWSSKPHYMHKAQWLKNKSLPKKLGPGTYFKDDSFLKSSADARAKTNFSKHGMLGMKEERFNKGMQPKSDAPGPGWYGVIGLEDKNKKSFSVFGTFTRASTDGDLKKLTNQTPGPGSYDVTGSIQHLLDKKISPLGPGCYDVKTSGDNKLNCNNFGKFSQLTFVWASLCLFLVLRSALNFANDLEVFREGGPGHYDVITPTATRTTGVKNNSVPFLTSSVRNGGSSFLSGNYNNNSVGPGRYNHQKFKMKSENGHESCFRSNITIPEHEAAELMKERLRIRPNAFPQSILPSRAKPQIFVGSSFPEKGIIR